MKAMLLRHTRVAVPNGTCYGRGEVPLADTFDVEAVDLAACVPWPIASVWTSPSRRCRQLADWLAGGVPVQVDDRLAEMHFGAWEGRPWSEITDDAARRWFAAPWTERPPGGESAPELLARVGDFRAAFLAQSPERAVIVTHAGVIRAWLSLATARPLAELFEHPIAHGQPYPAE